jgi:nucleotide-binding universal stress UspA family protein
VATWPPGRILVGTDGSEHAVRAVQAAIDLATAVGSALAVCHVTRLPEGWWGLVSSPPPASAVADAMTDAGRHALDRTLADVQTGDLVVERIEELGVPDVRLVMLAAEGGYDLIVLGTRGAGAVERVKHLVRGSTADRVAHEATVPVLLVP